MHNYHQLTILLPDIDECSRKTDNCNEQATCANNIGSFICTCNEGFKGDGEDCEGQ